LETWPNTVKHGVANGLEIDGVKRNFVGEIASVVNKPDIPLKVAEPVGPSLVN